MAGMNETSVCLTAASEEMLYNKIMSRSYSNFPMNKIQVKGAAKKVLMEAYKSHAAKRDLQQQLKVTDEWFLYFTEKYPDILENMFKGKHGKSCSESNHCSEEEVNKWHENIQQHILRSVPDLEARESLSKDPKRVFLGTVDNFLFRDRVGKYVMRGIWGLDDFSDVSTRRTDENLACISAMNATGEFAPVLISFKSCRISPHFKDSLPKNWSIECSASGWVDTNSIISYINKFVYWLKISKIETPVVLVLLTENHYLSIDVSDFCEKNNVILCCLPKHIYQVVVPDDPTLNVLSQQKSCWQMLESVTRPNFCFAYNHILSNIPSTVFTETFQRCGIFPLDKSALDLTKCRKKNMLTALTPTELALDGLEKILPQRTLLQFQNSFPYLAWFNHSQNTALFHAWARLKQKARGTAPVETEDVYDEEFSDEIRECVEIDQMYNSNQNSPEAEITVTDPGAEQEATSITIPSAPVTDSESDVAVALIQQMHSEDVHDTIAIALANMGDVSSDSLKRQSTDAAGSPSPIKIPKEPLQICRPEVRGVITSLMQNQGPMGKTSPSMPINPNTPRTTCKIISPDLVEADVDKRVAAGISYRAKVPASVLAALRNNVNPIPKRTKRESV